ncbi:retrovirus-related pol polyprotein from transposon TNT 1-94 [Tanacetum coccineum]
MEPISHRLKNNRDTHEVYLEKTIENTDTLHGLVECAIKQNPSEPLLESTCVFTKHVQELLVYISKTCPGLTKPTKKLVVVTPMNKDKKVRFAEPVTSSSNIPKQTDSLRTKDSNKPLLTSTGVNTTTSASGSKPLGNIKKNRILRPLSSNQKNKVEEHPRKVKSILNKTNSVSKPISNAHVKHSMIHAKFESICAICNKCLFDANYDMCVIDYVNDVNVRSKSKSKRNKIRKVWKPTSKVFNEIGYSWKPIVYSRRPKAPKLVGSSSKSTITESRISNSLDPTQYGGSTVFDVPSSSLNDCRSRMRTSKTKVSEGSLVLFLSSWPIRIQSINGRKYILVIVDDYSRFTWVKFLRSKDDVPEFMIKFLKMIQVRLNATIYLGKLKPKADIGIFVGYAPAKKAFRIYNIRTCLIIETIHADFDELTTMASEQFSSGPGPKLLTPITIRSGLYLNPPPCVNPQEPAVIASESAVSTSLPSSTIIDQDAPSTSTSQTNQETPSLVIPLGVKEADLNIKIESMQEELNEFERLEVWELVPRPDHVMIITLKWIYKVKFDKLGGVLKNKAHLVAWGYHQEEGIEFEESFAPVA